MNRFLSKVLLHCSPAMLLALLLLAMSLFNHWQCALSTPTTDFFTYWGVPRVMRSLPVGNIYDRDVQKKIFSVLSAEAAAPAASQRLREAASITSGFYGQRVGATGSPLLYALAGLFSTGDFDRDRRHYIAFCLICLISSLLVLCRLLKFPWTAAVLALVFFSSFYAPVISDLQVGNLNQIQLLIITLYILLTVKSKPFRSGLVMGMGIALKPNIAAVWLFYVIAALADKGYRRLTSHLLGTAGGALIAVLFSSMYFGRPSLWLHFSATLPGMLAPSYPVSHGNMALPMLIAELTGLSVFAVIGGALLCAYVLTVMLTRRPAAAEKKNGGTLLLETFAVTGIGGAALLIAGSLAWLHYFVLLIPLTVFLLRPTEGEIERGPYRRTMIRLTACAALLLFSTATPFLFNGASSQAVLFNIAAVLFLAAGGFELWDVRSRPRGGV